ncbi:MAG: tRNA glutamyl-Q(34) synthetase GluQRS [Alteromonadaceae bacterium]|nr:tRNA glutamyl-Q(34) synthetase GluQRS [Alteromonadaceae bacterium]|tara:strand:- start:720 stop:1619 length:900 start_codon:yes stop_codon:yes gene_type:complete
MSYRGRFAPSPTGPLHFGSLVAALASYLDARANGGQWLLRIEDLDPLRDSEDDAKRIITALEVHGLEWDGPVRFQSEHFPRYREQLQRLQRDGFAYLCPCSRKELQANNGRHPRHCRSGAPKSSRPTAIRFALTDRHWSWDDLLLGPQSLRTRPEIDDFVLQRKEGFFAYQLAVVCDDIDQGITHVVRGSDLLDSTPFQLALYQAFDSPPPAFMHLPVIVDSAGQKLSKQSRAPALVNDQAGANLASAFAALNHPLPVELGRASPAEQLAWGTTHWCTAKLPSVMSLTDVRQARPGAGQ